MPGPIASLCVLFILSVTFAQQIVPVQVLSISAGPSGSDSNGVFTLTEERSLFSRSTDREVIILFRWENAPGPHQLVAQWRSPDGGATASSTIDYNAANKRFGAVWRLPVTPTMSLGQWSIEVTMDSRPAGRFTFEITDAKVDAPKIRRPLTEAEIYERLNRLFVVLRRGTADGHELETAAGFLPLPATGHIYTVLPAIDGADTLRSVTVSGAAQAITQLVRFNRRQQWAVVQGDSMAGESLPVIQYDSVAVGSRCFSMEGNASTRVLVGGTISGRSSTSGGPAVLIATFPRAFGMPGAPVLDEFGELIGIVGAGMPGDSRSVDDIRQARGELNGAPVIPFPLLEVEEVSRGVDLATLRAAGDLMPSLVGGSDVVMAGFTRAPVKRGDDVASAKLLTEFSVRDKAIAVLATWMPKDRLRGEAVVRVFDVDNRVVASSQPRGVNFRKGDYTRAAWELQTPPKPGIYRVDILIDTRTYWRGFFRVDS